MTLLSKGPRNAAPKDASDVIELEVLLHSDLSRIGQRWVVATADGEAGPSVVLGREYPVFEPSPRGFLAGTSPARALDDPCVSRHQLSLRWNGSTLEASRHPSGKCDVRFYTTEGAPIDAGVVSRGAELPLLIALGERVLLVAARRPPVDALETDLSEPMVGHSAEMSSLRHRVANHAAHNRDVLLVGETGIGKSLVATALHRLGPRKDKPLVTVDCATLSRSVLEAELFGHEQGAFTDAKHARRGLAVEANGGTLFLDEIGELPLDVQTKLLRLVQEKKVRPVGGRRDLDVDARLVCATSRPLEDMVAAGTFRKELFYRVKMHPIDIAPLRARRDDIPVLWAAFIRAQATAHTSRTGENGSALEWLNRQPDEYDPEVPIHYVLDLLRHDWPGNIRELAHHCEEVVAASIDEGSSFALPDSWVRRERPTMDPSPARSVDVPRMSRDELVQHLRQHAYNQSETARALGMSRKLLRSRMDALGIRQPKDIRDDEIRHALELRLSPDETALHLGMGLKDLRERVGRLA